MRPTALSRAREHDYRLLLALFFHIVILCSCDSGAGMADWKSKLLTEKKKKEEDEKRAAEEEKVQVASSL